MSKRSYPILDLTPSIAAAVDGIGPPPPLPPAMPAPSPHAERSFLPLAAAAHCRRCRWVVFSFNRCRQPPAPEFFPPSIAGDGRKTNRWAAGAAL
ncbi:unnamed protein product [Linum trigynum]|uniref:Uncharacterized protein n=1 Tax=Linum trigynum TaxID=586398 RepID=A0AAV2FDL3_9ROSI